MKFEGFGHIVGAGRIKTTVRSQQRRDPALVEANEPYEEGAHGSGKLYDMHPV
jgi:hypothetical protein